MDLLSIRIKICDRTYPMKVRPQDEAYVRKAGILLEERINQYRSTSHISDRQDLLAMVAFDFLVESLKAKGNYTEKLRAFIGQIQQWKEAIDQSLDHHA